MESTYIEMAFNTRTADSDPYKMGNKRVDTITASGYGLRRVLRLQCRKEKQDGTQWTP
jgi:hypothetical protein